MQVLPELQWTDSLLLLSCFLQFRPLDCMAEPVLFRSVPVLMFTTSLSSRWFQFIYLAKRQKQTETNKNTFFHTLSIITVWTKRFSLLSSLHPHAFISPLEHFPLQRLLSDEPTGTNTNTHLHTHLAKFQPLWVQTVAALLNVLNFCDWPTKGQNEL